MAFYLELLAGLLLLFSVVIGGAGVLEVCAAVAALLVLHTGASYWWLLPAVSLAGLQDVWDARRHGNRPSERSTDPKDRDTHGPSRSSSGSTRANCDQCGDKLRDKARFCVRCGASLIRSDKPPSIKLATQSIGSTPLPADSAF